MTEDIIQVTLSDFERMMEACCNQNKCLDNPKECQCCSSSGINLEEMIEGKHEN